MREGQHAPVCLQRAVGPRVEHGAADAGLLQVQRQGKPDRAAADDGNLQVAIVGFADEL